MYLDRLASRLKTFVTEVTDFPVLPTAATLWERFKQDRLMLTASALTFTTVLSLVPFFAVVLSVFTAFPIFGILREALEQWLIDSLIPRSISTTVLDYLTQFAAKASELGAVGFVVLVVTALSLILTIDHTLNDIWRVTTPRRLSQRLMVYWAVLTLGPLVLGGSLAITSYVLTVSRGWLPDISGSTNLALDATQFLLMTFGLTLLYRFVPNTPVNWRHALAGGLFVAMFLGLAKLGLGWYLSRVPSYSLIYGAFATVPILLLWVQLSWLIVLFGAVIAAYLPSLLSGVARRSGGPGWDFQLATEVLQALVSAQAGNQRGLTLPQLAAQLRVDTLQLSPIMGTVCEMGWVGELSTRTGNEEPRYVLMVQPAQQPLRPLMEKLLLKPDAALGRWWDSDLLRTMTLADLLPPVDASSKAESAASASGSSAISYKKDSEPI